MANMSYCRFENTAKDLRDCLENMDVQDDEISQLQRQIAFQALHIPVAEGPGKLLMESFTGKRFRAIMSLEIGGGNAIQSLMAAAHLHPN